MQRGFGYQNRRNAGFSPASLFAGGTVQGAWYDPSDSTTLFSDRAGTTPCGTPGGGSVVPVGLMLDKSQGLVLGSELVTNGGPGFTATTGWTAEGTNTVAVVGGELEVTLNSALFSGIAGTNLTTVAGQWYRIVVTARKGTTPSNFTLRVDSSSNDIAFTSTNSTTVNYYFRASGTSAAIRFLTAASNGAGTFYVTSVSVKAIAGNHAIAANDTTARPELRAVVNLLNGSATLATQSVTTVATTYTLYFTGSGSITLSGTATGTYVAGSSSVVCTAGTLTLTVSGTVTTADLRPANSGAQLPVYQARTDANTYDAVGFPRYLAANGTSSAMSTPANVNLSGTDKVTVFAGVRKLSDAAQGVVAELSATIASNNGTFLLAAPNSAAANYNFSSKGTTQVNNTVTTFTAPITNVLTGQADIAAPSNVIRVNGAPTTVTSTQGTGNFGSYPLFIGARNNASNFLNGNIYSLIVVGSAVSAGQISATEQWVAQRTGIVI